MALLGVQSVTISFGGPPLLDGVDLHIEEGDRLCLVGRNGAGKSTLLKLMAGMLEPDDGTVTRTSGMKASYLGQELAEDLSGTAADSASEGDEGRRVEAERLLTLFGIDPGRDASSLSGGEVRRLMLARTLSVEPDLLLLDEPTNHLDLDTILALEEYLVGRIKTFVFVTHDRAFARRCANRVAEIDRGAVYAFRTGYDEFVQRREELLAAEEKARRNFDRKLAEEEKWLRKGLKARRTRNEGRVRKLMEMRERYRERREPEGAARMEIHEGERSGKKVVEAKKVTFGYGGTPLVKDFSTTVLRGDRVGVVGPNGSGKTTLLKLLLGEIEPEEGSVRLGAQVQPVYFDQMRSELDPDKTVMENIGDGAQTVVLNGRKKHVMGYLQDFLFPPERAKSPVAHLSGGELGRLMLARLFTKPANLLVLDEPTNDLDIETLELLEDLLLDYEGTLLLVSHDRDFLDNVVTDCFVLDGTGRVIEYAGGYGDWKERERERKRSQVEKTAIGATKSPGAGKSAGTQKTRGAGISGRRSGGRRTERPRKISFKERRELEELPDSISSMEEERDRIHAELSDPELYRGGQPGGAGSADPSKLVARLEELEAELERAYERWEFLESLPR